MAQGGSSIALLCRETGLVTSQLNWDAATEPQQAVWSQFALEPKCLPSPRESPQQGQQALLSQASLPSSAVDGSQPKAT